MLSDRQWKRNKGNSIVLSDLVYKEVNNVPKIFYNDISVGDNIKITKKNGKRYMNLGNTCKGHTFIVTRINEIKKYDSDTIFMNKEHPSEYVVLAFGILDKSIKNQEKQWSKEDVDGLLKCKKNIVDEGKHFESKGTYIHFGNVGLFGRNKINNDSSVSTYVCMKGKEDKAESYEEEVAAVLETAVNQISKYVPIVESIIAPVFSIAYRLQEKYGSICLEQVKSTESGLWQSSICVNAQTRIFHTEKDSTYTVITVPLQKKKYNRYEFLFKINESNTLVFNMLQGLSFFFSAKFLTHRQACCQTDSMQDYHPFFNFSSYGNAKLFSHCRCSFQRNMKKKKVKN